MIIDNLNLVRVQPIPTEAKAPLVVDSDAVLPSPIPFQGFQPVARRGPQIVHVATLDAT
jgi:hypothetical protein